MAKVKAGKKKKNEGSAPGWIVTYGDLMTLLLTFFVMLLAPSAIDGKELRLILANFPGLGNLLGGESFNEGPLPHSGQINEALPAFKKGRALDQLKRKAVQVLKTDQDVKQIQITQTERGLAISLASDIYFEKYSARLNIEDTQVLDSLRRIASLMRDFLVNNPDVPYVIEGHTDEESLPVGSPYEDNWGLSSARSLSMLRFLDKFLVPIEDAEVSGFGDTKPLFGGGEAASSLNRRIDIIILNEGNL